jgi:peptide/nickel transport system substrate-binding protein
LFVRLLAAALVVSLLAVSGAGGAGMQAPKRGGTVVVGGQVEGTCLNVLGGCSGPGGIIPQVIEGAFEIGPDLTYRRNLVSKVDVTKEPLTLTYHIRPKARWSDGTPVTASDFDFTYRALLAVPPATEILRRGVRTIRSVAALDAKTFRVSFRSFFRDWRELFHEVLPRHALVGEDLRSIWRDTIDNPKTGEPIGSGPFLIERWERGRQLVLARSPRYWGPHTAHLDRIVYQLVQGNIVEALRSGQVDIAQLSTGQEVKELQREPGIRVLAGASGSWEHFDIRLGGKGHPALRSRLVRRALAYGVDREALVQALYGPAARPSDSAVFLTQSRFYRPHWDVYRYRPAEARRLLEQAGCRRGADGIYVCAGKRLSLRFVTAAGWPSRELELQLVQAQLRRVGVEVKPVYAPSDTFLGKKGILPRGNFDVALYAWVAGASGISDMDIVGCKGPLNYTGYCDPEVTRDLRRSDLILDPRRRAALLNRVDEQLARDVPVLPLFQNVFPVAVRATIHGVVYNFSEWLTWNSEDWWLDRER